MDTAETNKEEEEVNSGTNNVLNTSIASQTDSQKDDEDVLKQLDAIKQEIIDLDYDDPIKEEPPDEEEETIDNSIRYAWYEEKLEEKVTTMKEKVLKLAQELKTRYPLYSNWLGKVEKEYESPLCKLDQPRSCPLDNPYTNRWQFECKKKTIQDNENDQLVWKLEPKAVWGLNTTNEYEFAPFVLSAVKVFEEFLQKTKSSDDQDWLMLKIRCNSSNELMLLPEGKNITQSTMDCMKQEFETGPGKDLNVKSLYCRTTNKCKDGNTTVTAFLLGSKTLNEQVCGINIQLSPKTTFWSNAAGAENLARTIADLLAPNPKITIIEIGCGIGLIGLSMASKCEKIIGVDSQSEIEEANQNCQLNSIKNASFLIDSSEDETPISSRINSKLKNSRSYAIVNTNSNSGRSIEILKCMRKNTSLRRIVMVMTLSKQFENAISELTRPADKNDSLNPFVPIRACLVDTLPFGRYCEVIILMERRCITDTLEDTIVPNTIRKDILTNNKSALLGKRSIDKVLLTKPNKRNVPNLLSTKRKAPETPWRSESQSPRKEGTLRINPFAKKRSEDLREKLSASRKEITNDLAQTVKEQKDLLKVAKEKLNAKLDFQTVKELHKVLNAFDEQTTKLEQQLPDDKTLRSNSVWDRIAPAAEDRILKGRFVQETKTQDILITTSNIKFEREDIKPEIIKTKYTNLAPLEPNLVMPSEFNKFLKKKKKFRRPLRLGTESWPEPSAHIPLDRPSENWDDDIEEIERHRYSSERMDTSRQYSPPRRGSSLYRSHESPPRRYSPPRYHDSRYLSPLRRPASPPHLRRRGLSPPRRDSPPPHRRGLLSPPRRLSPSPQSRRSFSPTIRRSVSPQRRLITPPPRRPVSPRMTRERYPSQPPPRQLSPSPRRFADELNIPSRSAIEKIMWSGTETNNRWNNVANSGQRWEPPPQQPAPSSNHVWHHDKDYGDLPEDARDPWGDDSDNVGWGKFDGQQQQQQQQQMSWNQDPRMKPNYLVGPPMNTQYVPPTPPPNPQWSAGPQINPNMNWIPQNDMMQKPAQQLQPPRGWPNNNMVIQQHNYTPSWPAQQYGYQQQQQQPPRQFNISRR